MDRFQVDFNEEVHCDDCGDIVHFHIDPECPVCHVKNAPSDQYWSVQDCIEEGGLFKCERCDTQFVIESFDFKANPEATIVVQAKAIGPQTQE